jgi:hypothetical protein
MMPKLIMMAARVVAQIHMFKPGFRRRVRDGAPKCGPLDGEFFLRSNAAMGTRDEACHLFFDLSD